MDIELAEMKEQIAETWSERAPGWARQAARMHYSARQREAWSKILSASLPRRAGPLRILDLGCGPGYFAQMYAEMKHETVGLDLAPGMIEVASNRTLGMGLNLRFQVGDVESLPFADEEFDAVSSSAITWLLLDPHKAFREWSRVLRRGGTLITIDYEQVSPAAAKLLGGASRIASALEASLARGREAREPMPPVPAEKKRVRDEVSRARPMRHPTRAALETLYREAGLTDIRAMPSGALTIADLRTRPPSWWFKTEWRLILAANKP